MLPEQHKTLSLQYLINESMLGNSRMQELLYRKFAVTMYYQCLRYLKNTGDAEDVVQEGFIKVFANLHKYRNEGSFEGWIRKIMTRSALSYLRDNKKYNYPIIFTTYVEPEVNDAPISNCVVLVHVIATSTSLFALSNTTTFTYC